MYRRALILLCGIMLWFWWLMMAAPGQGQNLPRTLPASGQPLTRQEVWVLEKVAAGKRANLLELAREPGGSQELCLLRGEFLEALITDGFPGVKIHRHGVQLAQAVIRGKLDLEFAQVTHDIGLVQCTFLNDVNCADANFKQNLRLDGSCFLGDAYFLKMKVAKNLYLVSALFLEGMNLNGVEIDGSLNATGAFWENPSKDKMARAHGLRVGKSAYLSNSVCNSPLDFRLVQIGQILDWQAGRFCQDADFDSLKVGYSANFDRARFQGDASFPLLQASNFLSFRQAIFQGKVDLGGARIGRDLRAANVTFASPDNYASFFRMHVGNVADFHVATFQGPVDFGEAHIGLEFRAAGAQFSGPQQRLFFTGMKIGTQAVFTGVRCAGPVSFAGSHIGGQFLLRGTRFENPQEADFSGLTVGQLLQCTDTVFLGAVDFTGANIGGKLQADVQESGTILAGGIFKGKVAFPEAQVSDLVIKGRGELEGISDPEGAKNLFISHLNLERMVIRRSLKLERIDIQTLSAWGLKCDGPATFSHVTIAKEADLRDSTFQSLKFEGVIWPAGKGALRLGGMTYKDIFPADNPQIQDWQQLISWVHHSPFDARNYLNLQAYFRRIGQEDLSDETLIEMKRRELRLWWQQLCPSENPVVQGFWPYLNVPQALTFLFWDLPVGYGRKPLRVIWFALPVILMGAWCFDPKYLSGVTWPQKNRWYNLTARLLLSLDKFTPSLFNLGFEETWKPPELSSRVRLFMYFHRLMGRIFLAIFGLAIWAKFK